MSLTSYRAAPPRAIRIGLLWQPGFPVCRSSKALPSAVRRGLLRLRRTAALCVCFPADCSEAKRPLEGGLSFRQSRLRSEKIFDDDHGVSPACGGQCMIWTFLAINRPGSDLLSRVLRRSTIGAGAFHGRVRNGNGCSHPAITTRSIKGKNVTGDGDKPK